jgi:peptide/nickel transport system substrate-binding protein
MLKVERLEVMMITRPPRYLLAMLGLLLAILLAACGTQLVATPTSNPTVPPTIAPSPSSTPSPAPSPSLAPSPTTTPRVLTICQGAEPDTLYIYGGSMLAQSNVLAAIYDGPIDTNGFSYQPVILEKLPSLADGDALLQPVAVQDGDVIVNDAGEVTLLKVGQVVRPFGCNLPSCAITWDGSPLEMGQLSSTFTLLEGVRWSDGEPLTAQDSVFSFRIASDPDSHTDKYTIQRTESYTALDDRTVQWVGRPGFLDSNYQINFFHPLPEHQLRGYKPALLLNVPETNITPLGWGPYMIQKWEFGNEIKLIRNPYYFRAAEGLPHFDQVTYRFLGSGAPLVLAALLNGECDIVDQEASVKSWDESELQALLDLEAAGQLRLDLATGTSWEHVDFNLRPLTYAGFASLDADGDGLGPFGDIRLRQAVAMCMDRRAVVDSIFLDQTFVLNTYLSPQHPLYNPDVSVWPFDPLAANALLDEIGWLDTDGDPTTPRLAKNVTGVPDGTPLEFFYETTVATQRKQTTQILAESLAQCGIKANLAYFEAADWFADPPEGKLFGRRFDLGQFAWLTGVDPPCNLFVSDQIPGPVDQINPATGQNYLRRDGDNETGYSSADFDAACNAARSALPGTPEYTQNHLLAQEIFARDLPVIPLFLRIKYSISRPDFCGHTMDPTANGDFWNIEEYDYGVDCP